METGEKLTVKAERLAPEGEGICRAEGSARVVFVPYTVPHDKIVVEIRERQKNFARGRILEIIEKGPERIVPQCPLHFDPSRPDPACGGCDWQQLPYAAQLKYKRELVADCLRRLGKIEAPVEATLASPREWAYRNKVQVPMGRDERGGVIGGFYAPASHRIVDFQACPVQPDLSVKIALRVKDLAARLDLPVYDEKTRKGWLKHLFIRTNSQGKALAALVTRSTEFPQRQAFIDEMRAAFPEMLGLHQNIQPLPSSVILGPEWRKLWGAPALEEQIGRWRFIASPGAFLQVNTPAAELLYDAALAALTHGGHRFKLALDLYCGVGTLSLWISQAVDRVIGVEESRLAVQDAWANAKRNAAGNVRFIAGKAESALPRLRSELPGECAAVVDPPRAGLAQPVLRFLTSPSVRRLVYVSCNPATFARDAAYLRQSGFKLERVRPVDLFPQTSHVELVGLFDRLK
ncbi:MAG: 23S rRNA (uracil(1939)-C(5))-methyltransferase RlmD [Elusimicrobia bacterium]|nr:23S rRNA (uracil(1939)-C(5))-methyltransferase RlmD [Elusimicrobiota bacterium]